MFSFRFFILAIVAASVSAFVPMGSRVASRALNMAGIDTKAAGAGIAVGESNFAGNVVACAQGSNDHKTLVAAVVAAKLDGVLSGAGPFSVFAPTDAAFAKLPSGTVEGLLKNIPELTKILTFHVSSNQQKPTRNGRSYDTLLKNEEGDDFKELGIRVTVDTCESFVLHGTPNKAKISASVKCSNGYVHVIDEVLMPYKGKTPPSMALKNTDDPNLSN